ncbi:MAG TPA: hypothetical protein VKG62_05245 [Solirubrobacteraceae bacterium]|nr:hypothetical protein [Solirubrobacteraceae bacterium]
MPTDAKLSPVRFDPTAFGSFRFVSRDLDSGGRVTLRYALDEQITFVEEFDLPIRGTVGEADRERCEGLLSLLHWVAGVSYFKTALPPELRCETGDPPEATAALLEALYSEGLGEFAFSNGLGDLPRPRFSRPAAATGPAPTPGVTGAASTPGAGAPDALEAVLVPVGGGKDSVLALEIVRRSGVRTALLSVGEAPPIARTVAAAGLEHLIVRRRLDPLLAELNRAGALNGHVPVTAIIASVALLTASLHGFDAVAMANERSASSGNLVWEGIEVNHQFSKGRSAERLLRAALAEIAGAPQLFSVLRPASELAIARAFAGMERYHGAFTSCNAVFRIDPSLRAASWCCECPKCRFVFLALAPFTTPARLREIFGRDLLAEEGQFEGFALLTATGGDKPFECVGEEQESLAAIRMLACDPRWRDHAVVARLAAEVLPRFPPSAGDPAAVLALSDDHDVPPLLMREVRAVLRA